MRVSLRIISLLGFLICAAVLCGAVFIENNYMVSPCPLCMLQRIVYAALGITFILGVAFNFKNVARAIYLFILIIFSCIGLALASYQFWLQYFAPPQKTSCGASLERLIEMHPILDALKIALSGSAECATVDFTIFTISIAGWSVLTFGMMLIGLLYVAYRNTQSHLNLE